MGAVHVVAFASLILQVPILFSDGGVAPVRAFLSATADAAGDGAAAAAAPTLLWAHVALGVQPAALLTTLAVAGLVAALAVACGKLSSALFVCLWAMYLSAVSIGQGFLSTPGCARCIWHKARSTCGTVGHASVQGCTACHPDASMLTSAYLRRHRDALLLEVTFACIWVALQLPAAATPLVTEKRQQQQGVELTEKQQCHTQRIPSVMLLRWLLFKHLLTSGMARATVACAGGANLGQCYKAIMAHGTPHVMSR